MFEKLGITVVDADAISHELTASGGAAIAAIRQALGPEAIDGNGALDRERVRSMAFTDSQARARLESILHPMIAQRAKATLAGAPGPYVVYAVPLWLEKYGPGKMDPGFAPKAIVALDCDDETRIARVASRSGLSRAQIQAIMAAQVSRQDRRNAADVVLDNNGNLESLAQQVLALHQSLIAP